MGYACWFCGERNADSSLLTNKERPDALPVADWHCVAVHRTCAERSGEDLNPQPRFDSRTDAPPLPRWIKVSAVVISLAIIGLILWERLTQ
jgi:hypothetical protein